MTVERYDDNIWEIGMILLYMPGMRSDVVGTINIITDIRLGSVETRRWNIKSRSHEYGSFERNIEKHKIKIIGEV